MGRRNVRVIVHVVVLSAWVALALASGCRPAPSAEVSVQVALKTPDGVKVRCMDHARQGTVAAGRLDAAAKAKQDHYTLGFLRGTLLVVDFSDRQGDFKGRPLALIDPGDPSPWAFSRDGPAVLLNGRRIALDLTGEGAAAWLARQPEAALRTVRSILIEGDRPDDLAALWRFAGSGVLVQLDHFQTHARWRPFVEALAAVRPRGLVLREIPKYLGEPVDLTHVLPRLTELTHLVMQGPAIPDLRAVPKLRLLDFGFKGVAAPSLAPLAWASQLRFLSVSMCDNVSDLAPVGTLRGLESLTVFNCEKLTDLAAWSDLTRLRTLILFGCPELKDLSGLRRFADLTTLGMTPTPSPEQFRHVAALKKLKVLVVSKEDKDKGHPALGEFGKARPDVEIVGFCLGSAWMLAVAGLGIGAGLIRRRARR